MKKYRITVISLFIIGIAAFIVAFISRSKVNSFGERTNTECSTTERVFDYYGLLSSSETDELMDMIDKYQEEYGMDIAVVTYDENTDFSDIGVYDNSDNTYLTEMFCDYYRFGWEKWEPVTGESYREKSGTSIVLAIKWSDIPGQGDIWLCTSGRAQDRISDSKAEDIVNDGGKYLRDDPLKGIKVIINESADAMVGVMSGSLPGFVKILIGIGAALIITIIFYAVNASKKEARDTTTKNTYVAKNAVRITQQSDIFSHKQVTKTKISSESSGGGGGGGSHSGGGSHGGGGGHF